MNSKLPDIDHIKSSTAAHGPSAPEAASNQDPPIPNRGLTPDAAPATGLVKDHLPLGAQENDMNPPIAEVLLDQLGSNLDMENNEIINSALDKLAGEGAVSDAFVANARLGIAMMTAGNRHAGEEFLFAAKEEARQDGNIRAEALIAFPISTLIGLDGRMEEAEALALDAVKLARKAGRTELLELLLWQLGSLQMISADMARPGHEKSTLMVTACRNLAEAVDVAISLKRFEVARLRMSLLGRTYRLTGNDGMAIHRFGEALLIAKKYCGVEDQATSQIVLGDAHERADNYEAARDCYLAALELSTVLDAGLAQSVEADIQRLTTKSNA